MRIKGAETPPTQTPTHKLILVASNSNSCFVSCRPFLLEERTDQYWRTRFTKNERQRRIATADIALLVPDSNGSCVERWLELRSGIFVYRSLNFFSAT